MIERVVRRIRATASNQLDFVIGVAEDLVTAQVQAFTVNDSTGVGGVQIGLDSTSAGSADNTYCAQGGTAGFNLSVQASYKGNPAVGRHTLVWLEIAQGVGANTWRGVNGDFQQSGIQGEVLG